MTIHSLQTNVTSKERTAPLSKTIVITGSAGFAASHLVDHLIANTDWKIIGLDSFRHRGDSLRIPHEPRYQIHYLDLNSPISPRLIDQIGEIDYIVNMASDSHVNRSISDPVPFVQNNVNVALHTLEYARIVKPKKFIQISTDEVYGPAPLGTDFKEWSEMLPSNPYSASKAAQEMIAISYWRSYGVPVLITNTMNIFGERQDAEKFIPLAIRKMLQKQKLTIHGSESHPGMRHYIHARNHADALLFILQEIHPTYFDESDYERQFPHRFNIVGEIEVNNFELAAFIAKSVSETHGSVYFDYQFLNFDEARPGHDLRYSLSGEKLALAGWKAPKTFHDSLRKTVQWYLKNPSWLK